MINRVDVNGIITPTGDTKIHENTNVGLDISNMHNMKPIHDNTMYF